MIFDTIRLAKAWTSFWSSPTVERCYYQKKQVRVNKLNQMKLYRIPYNGRELPL